MTTQTCSVSQEAISVLGVDLRSALSALVEAIPGDEVGPSELSRRIGVNRVIVSKLLNALRRDNPHEVLQHVPGPDSLRSIAEGIGGLDDIPARIVREAELSIDRFASLIRDRFGTRGALNAAISDENDDLRKRYEETARYDVYNGMRHVLGVEGETWITSMIFAPNPGAEDHLSVTTIHGVLGMRRLRPDTPVRFTYGSAYKPPSQEGDALASPISLEQFFTNEPAPLQSESQNNQLVHRLAPYTVGKDVVCDMLTVSHAPKGCRRYAEPDRPLGGVAIYHDVPVRTLHCDAIVHESAFRDGPPRLYVYNPGSRGPANPNDPARDIDRIEATDTITELGFAADRFEAPDIANYGSMLRHVLSEIGESPEAYRVYRLRLVYPVLGFQYVIAFEAPRRPGG